MKISSVRYVDIQSQFKGNEPLLRVMRDVIESGNFILGPEVEKLEKNFAALCGTKYAVGVASGTDALYLSLMAGGVKPGDEVLTAPNSFLATAGAIAVCGAIPRFVDVDGQYNIDTGKLSAAISKKTKAIIPVHLTGNPAAMDEINVFAEKHGLLVVEDSCQAVAASYRGRRTGSLGHLAAFSLHPLKNLNTCGDGGIITTDNEEYYQKLLLMRNHGLKNRNESVFFTYNARLDALKAAVANFQIPSIDSVSQKRIAFAAQYDSGLSDLQDHITIPPRLPHVRQVFHTYVIQAERRNELIDYLNANGIETKIHYPVPIHLMEASAVYGYKKGDFPVCESQSGKIISLPIQHLLTSDHIAYVIEKIHAFYRG